MSTPLLWIFLPLVISAILFFIRRWGRLTGLAGTLFALMIAISAWKLPINQEILFGQWSVNIGDTFLIFGRRFTLGQSNRLPVEVIYLAAAFWFGGAFKAHAGRLFVPLGLSIVGLMTAGLAVEPFLYAAILIELAALACVPLLSSPGGKPGRGVLRFLVFQTLGMPFILLAGWTLQGVEASPADSALSLKAAVLLGIGFSFLLAIFPFHTWIPMLMEDSRPYTAGFVLFMLPGIISFLGLDFLDRYSWLRSSSFLQPILVGAGSLMIAIGGLIAAFQRNLGRIMAYAVIVETGFTVIAISNYATNPLPVLASAGFGSAAVRIFIGLMLARCLALAVWAFSLSLIQGKSGDLRFRSIQGIGWRLPVASAAVFFANLSISGFPLLVGFPARLVLLQNVIKHNPTAALWALVGSLGLLIAATRTFAMMLRKDGEGNFQIQEDRSSLILLGFGLLMLLVLGLVPVL